MKNPHERALFARRNPLADGKGRHVSHAALGLMIAVTTLGWSGSSSAQIAIDGRYWQYDGERVLLLGGWNHGHNPFIDHDTDNDKDKQGVSSPAEIRYENASDSRKQKYDVVRGFQDKFMDQLLSVTLRYDNVLYCMNNETHEDPAWGQYRIKFIESEADAQGKHVYTTDMFNDVHEPEDSHGLAYQFRNRDKHT